MNLAEDINLGYNGNTRIKKEGVTHSFTAHEIQEYIKCSKDPSYFACTYGKVIHQDHGLVPFNLYSYQRDMYNLFTENRFSIVTAARQSGKTAAVAMYLLWFAIFNSEKTIAILANKGATAREILSRVTLALENLPFFLQPGCKAVNKGSIEFANNSTILAAATSSSSIRGRSVACVVKDTRVCVMIDEDIYLTTVEKADSINKSKFIKKENDMHQVHPKLFYTVYKITNRINGKEYVGFHGTDDLDDGYMGSGKLIKRAIEKYGPNNFDKEYLLVTDNSDEAESLAREKISKSKIEFFNNLTPEEYNEWYEKTWTDDHKNRISDSLKGKPHSWQDKINKNPEKIRKSAEKHLGSKRSDESKKKMSAAKKGKVPHNIGKVYCYDPMSLETKLCKIEEIPDGWKRGFRPKCKS